VPAVDRLPRWGDPVTPAPVDVAARVRRVQRSRAGRWRATLVLGLRMALHAKSKFIGTLLGVTFAVLLATFQLGTMYGLLAKNTLFVEGAGADLWVVPPGTTFAQPGQRLSTALLSQARVTPGVAEASALVMTGTSIRKPGGGSEAITLVGVDPEGSPQIFGESAFRGKKAAGRPYAAA